MSSYYGDSGRSAPSWDALDAGDDEVLDTSEYQFANRDHILFAIDASESMHAPQPDERNEAGIVRGKSLLYQALKAIVDIERRKVITGPSDSIGILLYNVDPSKTPPSSSQNYKPGTYVLQPLQQINAESIKKLWKIVEEADGEYQDQMDDDVTTMEPEVIRELFPPCDPKHEMNIADMLVTCNFLFRDAGTKLVGAKRVFLITDKDDPPGSSNPAPAKTVFGDLSAYGISLNTCFLNRPGHTFDPRIYWNDILGANDTELPTEGMEMLESMLEDMVIRTAPKRRLFTVPLKFGGRDGDIEIGVSGYALIMAQSKGQPKYVRMRGQTVDEVSTKTQYTSAETGADLSAGELTSAYQFGDEAKIQNVLEPNWWETDEFQQEQAQYAEELLRIAAERKDNGGGKAMEVDGAEDQLESVPSAGKVTVRTRVQFTDKEIQSFRSLGIDPQIKIIGFQSPDNLLLQDNVKNSYFIYPDENIYTGSTRTFTALLKSCLKLNKHALALCRLRTNSQPEFCVLVPQKETFVDGSQDDPPGFHVIILPFVDDLRDPPKAITDNLASTDEQTIKMEKIVRRLKFKSQKYQPSAWRNPALEYHQKQLQALAFDEDFDTDAFEDRALPKYAGIHKVAGKMMKEWNDLIKDDERAVEALAPATKRNVVEVDEADVQGVIKLYQSGNINKAKVNELRDYAKCYKISLSGKTKKADMIAALEEHLEAQAKKKKAKN